MKIFLSLYRKRYHAKPDKRETARIQKYNCLKPSKVELSELIALIEQGCTFRPCAVNGSGDRGFISGQLVGIDIDNEVKKTPLSPDRQLKLEDAIAESKEQGFYPVFAYRTFSAKPLHDKFRIVFCLDRAVTDPHQWKHVYGKLAAVFGTYPDPACKNPSRVFFGTDKKADYTDLEARVDTRSLLSDYVPPTERKLVKRANTGLQKADREGGLSADVVGAIQHRDADFIRTAFGRSTPVYFNTRAEMFEYLYTQISLADLLNVSEGEAFSCIIPEHEDSDPSASVFRAENGTWLYKCQSAENCPTQGRPLTIKQLCEFVGDFRSEAQCIEFLKRCFNLVLVETEFTRQQKENVDAIITAVTGTDPLSFSVLCPTADHNIRFSRTLYISVLCYARDHIQPDAEGEGNFCFYMPVRSLVKRPDVPRSIDKVDKKLKLFIYHGLLEIVPFEELPKDVQKSLKAKQTNGYNTCQYYRIPSWVAPHLLRIESQAKQWKAAGYRESGICYEAFYRAEGEAVANRLYPQRKYKKLSAEADTRHEFLVGILLDMVQAKGYATEKEVSAKLKTALKDRGYTYSSYYADRQVKCSIAEACDSYGLKKARCNAGLKERFGISGTGYPTIIFMDEEEKGEL